ncbi:hypothetical protein GX50_03883 [[Emmonsia] crescens]|uniref:Uncharacterized protein n=1 Tax=[Emmonsia] crescens TaxID=73230 RepID=A0A2B7ZJ29_9EURO|nr:hypothetical protein GX50_03883 [Emmonsia crescens]
MNRQGTESSLSLSSECLSLDAQQNSTLLTYSNVLNDFLLEMQPQTYASAHFNDLSERPSVDRTSNNWCQHFSNVNLENNILNSGATTEPDEV